MQALIMVIAIFGSMWIIERQQSIKVYDNVTTQDMREERVYLTGNILTAQREYYAASNTSDYGSAAMWRKTEKVAARELRLIDRVLQSRGVAH